MLEKSYKPRFLAWFLWGLVSFFYAFQYIIRVSPSVMISDILQKFCITASEFGDFSGAYYLGYAAAHIPLGMMFDRYPIKWVISGTMFLSVIGLIPLIYFDIWYFSVLGRFLIGIGSSGAILGVFQVIRLYFPENWFSRLLGFSVTIGLLGAVYGSAPVHHLSKAYGWQNVLSLILFVGSALALCVALVVPKKSHGSETATKKISVWQEFKLILSNKLVLLTALFAALMVGPLEGFADVWAVPFLATTYGIEQNMAASLPSLIFIGMCVGAPLLAALAEKYQAYEGVIRLSALFMAAAFGIILFMHPPVWLISTLFFAIGILCSYQVLALTLNARQAPPEHSGFVTALTNMVIMSFGSIYHALMGRAIAWNWQGDKVNGIPVYSSQDYIFGISVIPLGLILAFIGFYGLKKLKRVL